MKKQRAMQIMTLLFLVVSLTACAGTNGKPLTPAENIAYAESVMTAANNTVADRLYAGKMTAEEGKKYRVLKNEAEILLNSYRLSYALSDNENMYKTWELIENILIEINTKYLSQKGADNGRS